jgi:WD40 repeat protein
MSSIHRNISCLNLASDEKSVSLDTLQIRVHCIVENPIDSHTIAVAGNDKRLCLWNTSEANHHTITLKPFMNKVQSGILALSWHPEKDNLIAFSTREGRLAVLDTTRFSNVPIILKPFTTHEIYSLTWAKLDSAIILLACSGGKLVYYTQKDYELHHLNQFTQICSISTSDERMVLGTNTGDLLICQLSESFKILTQRSVSKKYVGMISWHGRNMLAIASETGVTLVRDVDKFIETNSNEIVSHFSNRKGRVYSVRFNKAATHLVSCCMHGNIDVYSLSGEGKLVATMSIETPAYSAIFMPNNEHLIICGGQDSTVCAFEWEKYPPNNESSKNEVIDRFKSVEWATISELTTIAKHSKRRVKKKVKENAENGNLEEVTKAINSKLNLNSTKKSHSIFTVSSRELLSNSLEILNEVLNSDGSHRELSLNELMMGDRDDIQKFISKECEYFLENPKMI